MNDEKQPFILAKPFTVIHPKRAKIEVQYRLNRFMNLLECPFALTSDPVHSYF